MISAQELHGNAVGTDAGKPARLPRSEPTSAARVATLVVLVGVAYHYSLMSVLRSLGADNPLAYLGLIPIISLVFGVFLARPRPGEPDVHDRYLDYIVAIPALLIPAFVLVVLPTRMSTFFWLWRIDLLTLPVFVVGVVALLFGSRMVLRTKAAICFLVLVWPIPFRLLVSRWLDGFTSLSTGAVSKILGLVPLATPSGHVADTFTIDGPAGGFELVVATQCSGANGLLGFLLLAVPVAWLASGSRRQKVAWLAAGAALLWAMNVIRILAVFAVGKFWGETIAVDGFHPYIGLVTFAAGTAVMVWAMPKFGLRISMPPRPPTAHRSLGGARMSRTPLVILLVLASLMAVFNDSLRDVDPVASALGAARVLPFEAAANQLDGVDARRVDHFDWAKRYFGEDSDWTRYQLAGPGNQRLRSDLPVTADVVTTSDAGTFDDFGVEACYQFHGYDAIGRREVNLGRGQFATALSWQDPRSPIRWTSLFWYWPVNVNGTTRYQRVILMIDSTSTGGVWSQATNPGLVATVGISIDQRLSPDRRISETDRRYDELVSFLVALGTDVVAASAPTGPGSVR